MAYACLVDLSKCVGCRTCQVICRHWHEQPPEPLPLFSGFSPSAAQPELSASNLTVVRCNEVRDQSDTPAWIFSKRQCMHCLEPSCASACPVRALRKTPDGPVIYREDLCMGCRYCMVACPFDVPRFDYDKTVPSIRKCTFCASRLSRSETPDSVAEREAEWSEDFAPLNQNWPCCASRCPAGAIRFAEREKLLNFARARIRTQGHTKYIQHIYGEHEAGGTSWMYISDVPFRKLGFNPDISSIPYPEYTKPFLTGVPLVIILGSGMMTGLYWIIRRREELAAANGVNAADSQAGGQNGETKGNPQ